MLSVNNDEGVHFPANQFLLFPAIKKKSDLTILTPLYGFWIIFWMC